MPGTGFSFQMAGAVPVVTAPAGARRQADAEVTVPVSQAGPEGRLQDIQAITDAALSRLDDHDLLTELLERIRAILQADTAAVLLLELAADRAATAAQSLVLRADRVAAAALQRSLLPSALPAAGGAQMAARYVPGEGTVGGDWYDVFTLPSGRLCVVIGDVTGSGLRAAVIMGRMRSALRAYALDTCDPAEALRRLDRKMQHFEPGALATVLYAVFDQGLDRVHLCSPGARRQVATVDIDPGTLMCFYTDGLIERRDRPIDDGLALLCRTLTAQPPDAACAAVMAALVGGEPARDDIALLMVRRSPPGTP